MREDQNTEMGEAHLSQRNECRTRVRAVSQRAAAAIYDDIRGAWERLGPLLQIVKPLWSRRRALEGCAGNVGSFIECVESDANDNRRSGRFSVGERFCQSRRVNCF